MDTEKQLLDIISEKEEALRKETEGITKQAEELIAQSREKSSKILNIAETEGKKAADEYLSREMEKLKTDISDIRNRGIAEAEEIRTRGTSLLPRAVSKIISLVTG
jgi:vacuolar-type H+-ATPase subunit H